MRTVGEPKLLMGQSLGKAGSSQHCQPVFFACIVRVSLVCRGRGLRLFLPHSLTSAIAIIALLCLLPPGLSVVSVVLPVEEPGAHQRLGTTGTASNQENWLGISGNMGIASQEITNPAVLSVGSNRN